MAQEYRAAKVLCEHSKYYHSNPAVVTDSVM